MREYKSQLARLLASENISVEHKKTKTAYFDLNQRMLVLPVFVDDMSDDVYDLFIGHEVGHARFTPADGWHHSIKDLGIPRSIVNVLEDHRIEKKIRQEYPGLKVQFYRAYKELNEEKNFFGIKSFDVNTYNLIDRMNILSKIGITAKVNFNDEEKVFVEKMNQLETFEDVQNLAKEVYEYMKEKKKENIQSKLENNHYNPSDENEDNDIQEQYDDDFENDENENDDYDVEDSEQDDGNYKEEIDEDEESEESEDKESEESEDNVNDPTENGNEEEDDSDLESQTDRNFRQKENELVVDTSKEVENCYIPFLKLEKIINSPQQIEKIFDESENHALSYQRANLVEYPLFNNFLKNNQNVIKYLVKEFELKKNADQLQRSSIAKSGNINEDTLYQYKLTEDIFKRVSIVPGAKSHGLVMFIDWSGSMRNYLHSTVIQLLNLVLFCRTVNIPYEVYTFTSSQTYITGNINLMEFDNKKNTIVPEDIIMNNVFSSRMKNSEFRKMAERLLFYSQTYLVKYLPKSIRMGGTPLNEAIIAAMQIVPEFQKNTKVQVINTVFLTDGVGSVATNVRRPDGTINEMKSSDLIYVRSRNDKKNFFSYSYGDQTNEEITSKFLKMFKKETNSNVIGFYLTNRVSAEELLYRRMGSNIVNQNPFRNFNYPRQKSIRNYIEETPQLAALMKKFMNDNHFVLSSSGYDEYYIMNQGIGINQKDKEEFTISEKTKTVRGFATQFIRYNMNKLSDRVVLSRFVNLISR